MTVALDLQNAFRFHLQNRFRPYGDTRLATAIAIDKARQDVTNGKARYPAPIRQTYRSTTDDGLRLVGRVVTECGGRNGIWETRDNRGGWYCDTWQNQTCSGVVYQLPAHKGKSRFVAGYDFSDIDGGPSLDLTRIYTSKSGKGGTWGSAQDDDVARDVARTADSMAQKAAESELAYQTAWQAGSCYASEAESVADNRRDILELLAERKKAIRADAWTESHDSSAICSLIKRQVKSLLRAMRDSRAKMSELVSGDYGDLIFYPDARLRAAFCDGADLETFPAK